MAGDCFLEIHKNTPICLIKNKYSDSPVWIDLLKVRHIYLQGRKFQVNDDKMISFWMDTGLLDMPLCRRVPSAV
jgi:hypothetical protein